MYCSSCGTKLEDRYQFCFQCGRPTHPDRMSPWGVPMKMTRPLWEKKIGGVCAGFARYFDMDVTLMRILWLVVSLVTGIGFIAYLVAWVAMPAQERVYVPNMTSTATAPPPPGPGHNTANGGDNAYPQQA